MKKLFIFLLFAFCYLLFAINVNATGSLSLSPTSQSVNKGQTFNVDVTLNTGGTLSTACDIIITFNPQIIKVKTVSFGTNPLFSTNNANEDNTNGKLIINNSVMSVVNGFNGTGKLATVTFEAVSSGSSAVSFICIPQKTADDTNIWSDKGVDIVNCGANIGGTYTVTSGSGDTTSPTATPPPGSSTSSGGDTQVTPTPQPPVAGNISLTVTSFIFGIFFLLSGIFFRFLFLRT